MSENNLIPHSKESSAKDLQSLVTELIKEVRSLIPLVKQSDLSFSNSLTSLFDGLNRLVASFSTVSPNEKLFTVKVLAKQLLDLENEIVGKEDFLNANMSIKIEDVLDSNLTRINNFLEFTAESSRFPLHLSDFEETMMCSPIKSSIESKDNLQSEKIENEIVDKEDFLNANMSIKIEDVLDPNSTQINNFLEYTAESSTFPLHLSDFEETMMCSPIKSSIESKDNHQSEKIENGSSMMSMLMPPPQDFRTPKSLKKTD